MEAAAPHPAIARYARHVNPEFVRLLGILGYGRVFVRARDVWIWDDRDRQYLDMLAGFGSVNLGHNNPRLQRRLQEFLLGDPLNLCHIGPSVHTAELAEALVRRCGDPLLVAHFSSSGAEAVEAAMKLARAATGRKGFLYCRGGFHGTNLGALSVMGEERFRRPFEPLLPGCVSIPFGDLTALESELATHDHAGFLVEPVQCEAGVILPPPGYLARAQELCRRYDTLLLLDEVQTGMGRTGSLFAYQQEGFVPDVLVLAKALGGGVVPVGATVTSRDIHHRAYGSVERFDLASSTFGGNSLACVAALETLETLEAEGLVAASRERGAQLLAELKARLAGHPLVREVRGRGLLVAVELGVSDARGLARLAAPAVDMISRHVFGQWMALRLLEENVICQPASQQWNVLRFEPPLTIPAAEIDRVVSVVGEVLDEYRGVGPVMKDVGLRVSRQMRDGWPFR